MINLYKDKKRKIKSDNVLQLLTKNSFKSKQRKTVVINIRIEKDLKENFKKYCENNNINISEALQAYIEDCARMV